MAAVEANLLDMKRWTANSSVNAAAATYRAASSSPPPMTLLSFTKKLKRMPHLFDRVLELPFHADTVVEVRESRNAFTFVVSDIQPGLIVEEVKAELVEIVPGAIKVVVVGRGERLMSDLESSEVELWRFRLPASTVPEDTVAKYENEVLEVTIPKNPVSCAAEEVLKKDNDAESYVSVKDDGDPHTRRQAGLEPSDDCIQHPVTPLSDNMKELDYSSNRELDDSLRSGQESLDTEELQWQRDLFEDLESFGSPRRVRDRSSCMKAAGHQDAPRSPEFLHNLGSWVQGFAIFV